MVVLFSVSRIDGVKQRNKICRGHRKQKFEFCVSKKKGSLKADVHSLGSFMVFVQAINRVPSRKKMTAGLEKPYDDNAAELCTLAINIEKLSLTTDSWTALTTES